jgi:hypothetical protein
VISKDVFSMRVIAIPDLMRNFIIGGALFALPVKKVMAG